MRYERATRLFLILTLVIDIFMTALAFALSYFLRRLLPLPDPAQGMGPFTDYFPMLLIHVFSVITVFFFANLYGLARVSHVDEFSVIGAATTIGTLMGVAVGSLVLRNFTVGNDYSRAMILYAWTFSALLVALGRLLSSWLCKRLIRRGWGHRRVLVVGTGDIARMILQKVLWTPELGYDAVGVVSNDGGGTDSVLGVPVVGKTLELGEIIEQYTPEEVIIALPEETPHQEILWLISECERGRVTIRVYPDLFQIMAGPVRIGEMGGLPLLTVRDIAQKGWRRVAKRTMDIAGSLAALVVLSPAMTFIAILVKLESPGPETPA